MNRRAFGGFAPDALGFFERLAAHNDRAWFQAHKGEYDTLLKTPMIALLQDLNLALAARGVPLMADPKRGIMRINRDIRFARDKSPYKTNIAAVLTRGGDRHAPGMLYLHLAPERCFAGTGFYDLEPQHLESVRSRIARRPAEWRAVAARLAENHLGLATEDGLKRLPRGFEADLAADIAAAVKLRHYVSTLALAARDVTGPGLVDTVAAFAEAARGLLEFGWAALGLTTRRQAESAAAPIRRATGLMPIYLIRGSSLNRQLLLPSRTTVFTHLVRRGRRMPDCKSSRTIDEELRPSWKQVGALARPGHSSRNFL